MVAAGNLIPIRDRYFQVEEAEARDTWKRILDFCKENREDFIDDSFPPSPKSLFYKIDDPSNHTVSRWLRPHQISCDNKVPWTVFRTPFPSDISQGRLQSQSKRCHRHFMMCLVQIPRNKYGCGCSNLYLSNIII